MPIPISNDLFRDFLYCKYKAHLKISGKCGQKSDYEKLAIQLSDEYRRIATNHLLRSRSNTEICQNRNDLPKALRHGYAIVTDGRATVDDASVHFDAPLHDAAAIVFHGGGKVDGRYAEGRAELHDPLGGNGAGHGIKKSARVSIDGQKCILHQRRLLFRRGRIPDRFIAANLLDDCLVAGVGYVVKPFKDTLNFGEQ